MRAYLCDVIMLIVNVCNTLLGLSREPSVVPLLCFELVIYLTRLQLNVPYHDKEYIPPVIKSVRRNRRCKIVCTVLQ
jgi:hypothetical protein